MLDLANDEVYFQRRLRLLRLQLWHHNVREQFTKVLNLMCILTILTPILMILTPSKRAGLSKSSLCLLANRQQRSCKDITFSFS